MSLKKNIIILVSLFLLNGCVETAALIGPSLTVASTGNIYQAGLTYGTGKIIEKETGQSTVEHVSNILEPINKKKSKKINKDFIQLVENQIEKTRKIILKE